MLHALAAELPLGKFPAQTLPAGTTLHHYGSLDVSRDQLDRPIWVSDNHACATGYKNFGVAAPRYTTLVTAIPVRLLDLNPTRLQPIASKLQVPSHRAWNSLLAEYFRNHSVMGIVYCGREIFLADPNTVIGARRSVPC